MKITKSHKFDKEIYEKFVFVCDQESMSKSKILNKLIENWIRIKNEKAQINNN